jgi:hypothetical protein
VSQVINSYFPKGINVAPTSVDYDACSPLIQCHADKIGARIFTEDFFGREIRVLAFDADDAELLIESVKCEIESEAKLDVAFDDDTEVECWCGAIGKVSELYDVTGLDVTCGGLGSLNCHCGGDLCVCHHHGETECVGCPDCEDADDDEDWDE